MHRLFLRRLGAAGVRDGGELLLAWVMIGAVVRLLGVQVGTAHLAAMASVWPACFLFSRWVFPPKHGIGAKRALFELVLPSVALGLIIARGDVGLTGAQGVYIAVASWILGLSWRTALSASVGGETGEGVRLAALLLTAIWVTGPFITDRWVGGVDARWYGDVMADFILQWRSGVFPIFLGQGEIGFNGGVHPFRSAPYYQYGAGIWDIVTFRALSPVALQHLMVVTSAVVGGVGLYLALNALAPARRWVSMAVSIIFVTSAAYLAPIYLADQYLTYMAMSMMPILVYGNLAIIKGAGSTGWLWLAAGLSLAWVSHPPQAALLSLATAGIQFGRLVLLGAQPREWLAAVAGAICFGLLSCYYFVSMAEVESTLEPSVLLMVLQLVGGAAGIAGIGFGIIWNRWWGWVLLAAGSWMLAQIQPVWMWILIIAAACALVVSLIARARRRFDPIVGGWPLMMASFVVAGLVIQHWMKPAIPLVNEDAVALLRNYGDKWQGFFLPVSDAPSLATDFQPGWGAWWLAAGVAWAAVIMRSSVSRAVLPVLLMLVVTCVRIPWLSELWVAFQPRALVEITGLPLVNRMFPPMVAFACGAGFIWLTDLAVTRPRWHRVAFGFTLLLAAWGLYQARPFSRTGVARTHSAADTRMMARSENVYLGSYGYDLMLVPHDVSHGKMDVRLSSTIWGRTTPLRIGRMETALIMEAAERREYLVTTQVEPTAPSWLNLSPQLQLRPGEHILVRFEFLPRVYDGWLIFRSANIYRE